MADFDFSGKLPDLDVSHLLSLAKEVEATQAGEHARQAGAHPAPPVLTGGSLLGNASLTIDSKSLISIEKELYIQLNKKNDFLPSSFRGSFCDFDWFQGTIFPPEFDYTSDPTGLPIQIPIHLYSDVFFDDLKSMFPNCDVHRESHNSPNHYKVAESFYDNSDPKRRTRFLMIEYLGHNPGIHCTTSGFYSAQVSQLLRSYETRPSRVDVAIDNYHPKSGSKYFDQMHKKILKFAKSHGLKINMQGDWYTGLLGRTLYVGSRQSTAQLCFYEKGLQLHSDSSFAPVYPNWCRMEFRFRPDSKKRCGLYKNTPVDWLGSTKWVRDLLDDLGISVDKTESLRAPKAEPDCVRSRRFLVRQYGNTIEHWVNEAGSYDKFSSDLYDHLKKINPNLKI